MSMIKNIIIKTPPVLRVGSLYLIVLSVLSIIAYGLQSRPVTATANVMPIVQAQDVSTDSEEITGVPARLSIARLGIELPIVNGFYDREHDDWTLTDDAAQFASMTSLPSNKQGNTFLYGHNTAAVLEPVKDLVPGDELTVTTTNGHVFTYVYTRDMTVTPDHTEIVTPAALEPQVTLMTCEGWLSDHRRVMYFKFEKVS